jgi:hypothetical protein
MTFQRSAEQRKQMQRTNSNSPFFTRAELRSPIEVAYAGESSGGNYEHDHPVRPQRRRPGGGSSCGAFRLLVIWTAIMGGFGYFWFIGVRLPQVRLEIRKHLETTLEDLENENKLLKGTSNFESQHLLKTLDHVNSQLKREQQVSNQWKDKANGLEESNLRLGESTQQLQQAIQSYSRRSLLEK